MKTSVPPAFKLLTIVERDFVMVDHCSFGGHPIRSGTAYILADLADLDPDREKKQAGPICAQKHGILPDAGIPDLTRAMEISSDRDDELNSYAVPRMPASKRLRVIEYMILRAGKLSDEKFTKLRYRPIDDAYGYYKHNGNFLPATLFNRVAGVMEKNDRENPSLSYARLMGTHAINHWIERCEKSGRMSQRDHEFLRPIKQSLHESRDASQGKLTHFNKLIRDLKIVENPPAFRTNIFGP